MRFALLNKKRIEATKGAKYTYPRLKLQELWVSPVENLAPTVIKLVAGTGTST